MKVTIALSYLSLVTPIIGLVALIAREHTTALTAQGVLYMEIVVAILAVVLSNLYFDRNISKYLTIPNIQLKTEGDIMKKLLSLSNIIKNLNFSLNSESSHESRELYFWGVYKYYKEQIKDFLTHKTMTLDNIDGFSASEFRASKNQFDQMLIRSYLEEIIQKKVNTNKPVMILTALILMDSIKNLPTAIIYLSKMSKSNIFDKIIYSKLCQKVQQSIDRIPRNKAEVVDVKMFIAEEEFSKKFIQAIHSNTRAYLDLWTYYEERDVKIQTLYRRNVQIENGYNKVHSFWATEIEHNKLLKCWLAPVYTIYLSLVRNRPSVGEKIMKTLPKIFYYNKSERKGLEMSEEDLNTSNSLMFQASMSKEKLGRVSKTSAHITQVLGWTQEDIIGKNICTIMPPFMQSLHTQILEKKLEEIENCRASIRLNQIFESFVINNLGFISPCGIYLSIHPYIQEELIYVAIVKLNECKNGLILLSQDGKIKGINQQIDTSLDLKRRKITHIKEICRDYKPLEHILNYPPNHILNAHTWNPDGEQEVLSKGDSIVASMNIELFGSKCFVDQIHQYSVQISYQRIQENGFFILQLTEKGHEGSDLNSSFSSMTENTAIKEQQLDIPEEKAINEDTIPSPSKIIFTGNLMTQRSETQGKLLEFTQRSQIRQVSLLNSARQHDTENGEATTRKASSSIRLDGKGTIHQARNQEKEKSISDIDIRSISSVGSLNRKIEQGFEIIPRNTNISLLKASGAIFILIIPLTLIWFQTKNSEISTLINANTEVISQTTLLLSQTVEMNRISKIIYFSDLGLLSPTKYSTTNISLIAYPTIMNYMKSITKLTDKIRDSLDQIDSNLRDRAYSYRIPIYNKDDSGRVYKVQEHNIFGFLSEFIARSLKFAYVKYADFNRFNPDLQFIINNTLSDFLLVGEQIIPIIIEDSQIKLASQENLILPIFIFMSGIAIIIMFVGWKIIKMFILKRDNLLDNFFRLNTKYIQNHMKKVQKFEKALERGYFTANKGIKVDRTVFKRHAANPEDINSTKRKFIKTEGINNGLLLRCLSAMLLMVLVLSVYPIEMKLAHVQSISVLSKINLMAQSDNYLYQDIRLSTLIPEYVRTNGTARVRNRPIKDDINDLFTNLTQAPDFFGVTLLQENFGLTSNKTLYDLISGNVCNMFPANPRGLNLCLTGNGGIMTRGVVGMNSLILSFTQTAISAYDASPKSFSDMYNIINDPTYTLIEYADYFYLYPTYSSIDTIIKNRINQSMMDSQKLYRLINILFAIFCVLVGLLFWNYTLKSCEKEMTNWMKLVRQIPLEVLMSNKALKAHLMETSQSLFTFIKF